MRHKGIIGAIGEEILYININIKNTKKEINDAIAVLKRYKKRIG